MKLTHCIARISVSFFLTSLLFSGLVLADARAFIKGKPDKPEQTNFAVPNQSSESDKEYPNLPEKSKNRPQQQPKVHLSKEEKRIRELN